MTEWHFITGNKNKFAEASRYFPGLIQKELDLPEIQELDPRKVVAAKLDEARKHHQNRVIVEDISLSIEALGGLPGTLIKWFLQSLEAEGLAELVTKLGDTKATARIVIGYCAGDIVEFIEDRIDGVIVLPRGDTGFGWDPIFQPTGSDRTFAELKAEGGGGIRAKVFTDLYKKLRDK